MQRNTIAALALAAGLVLGSERLGSAQEQASDHDPCRVVTSIICKKTGVNQFTCTVKTIVIGCAAGASQTIYCHRFVGGVAQTPSPTEFDVTQVSNGASSSTFVSTQVAGDTFNWIVVVSAAGAVDTDHDHTP